MKRATTLFLLVAASAASAQTLPNQLTAKLTEEGHTFGSMIPFFKPLFSVASIPAGDGTLEIRAFDGGGTEVASKSISGLTIVKPPAPVSTATIAAMPHPRIYLPGRLAAI